MTTKPKYRRVLLKLSGEALKGKHTFGIDETIIDALATQIREVHELGVQLGIVIGGGNVWRGAGQSRMSRAAADYIGMLATMINSLCLQEALERHGVFTRVMSAIEMQAISEPYIRRRALRHLEKGRVVIFGCGTGNPFFTTDTAAALRGKEIEAEVLLKGTQVDGVYTSDPKKDSSAKKFKSLTFTQALNDNLKVMDATALSLCRENNLNVIVFDVTVPGNIRRAVLGEPVGTKVQGG